MYLLNELFFNYGLGIGVFLIGLYLLPYIILKEDSYVTIHDNLDSNFVWYTVLARSGKLFKSHSSISQIMQGIPRSCLPSGLNVTAGLFLFFKPFTAFVINKWLLHLIAFAGMYLLLETHFLPGEEYALIVLGVSLCFAILPFYSIFGLTIAGQPLLLYAFLNLLGKSGGITDLLIIFAFPFYSSLICSGIFILFCLGVLFLYDCFNNGKINTGFLQGLFILGTTYAIVEYDLIRTMFLNKGFVSHRTEFSPRETYNLKNAVKTGFSNFLYGQYHAVSSHVFILAVSLLVIAAHFITKSGLKDGNAISLLVLFTIAFIISLFYGFCAEGGLLLARGKKFTIFRAFNFTRFHWLHPFLWYLIFALALSFLPRIAYGKYVVVMLITVHLFYIVVNRRSINENEAVINLKAVVKSIIGRKNNYISYKQFFSEDLFAEIKKFINLPKKDYRVASIGIHPSIAQYSGFYTLDSYQANYPLEYKHKFRQIIGNELNKSKRFKNYFDCWGSRCYIFVAELEKELFFIKKDRNIKVTNLSLNTHVFKAMGGRYFFSAVEIVNAKDNNLILLKTFEREDSPWRIFLYGVVAQY